MKECEGLEKEMPCTQKTKKICMLKRSRRKLFKVRKGEISRCSSSVASSTSSAPSQSQKTLPISSNRKRKLMSASNSPLSFKRKLSLSSRPSPPLTACTKSQDLIIPKSWRCLFMPGEKKH